MHSKHLQFFYELLAHALWYADKPIDPEDFPTPPTEGEWQKVFEYATAHSVIGIFGKALPLLPDRWQPKPELFSSIKKIISDDNHAYRRHADSLIHLYVALNDHALQPVFFKSAVWASYYPCPEHLRIHSLDFFITPSRRADALRCMDKMGASPETGQVSWEKRYLYQGLHCRLFFQTYLFAYPRSRRYYQELEAYAMRPAQLCKFNIDEHWLPTFPPLFSIICQTACLQHQLLLGRLTLRQICDWTMLLYCERTALGIAENQLLRHLNKLHLQRFYDALGNFARRHLGLPNSSYAALHMTPQKVALGERLASEVWKIPLTGDLTDPACPPQEKWGTKVSHLTRIFKQCWYLRHLCPHEWFFTPWKELKALFFPSHIQ